MADNRFSFSHRFFWELSVGNFLQFLFTDENNSQRQYNSQQISWVFAEWEHPECSKEY